MSILYIDFVDGAFDLTETALDSENIILLRSLTKAYCIPGIRLGYLLASKKIVKEIRKVKPPWNVSTFAQAAGIAAMKDETFLLDSRKKILNSKKIIENQIDVHSDSNFYLHYVKDAKKVKKELMDYGVLVRDCTSFGLPSHIRFSVRKNEENEVFLNALCSCNYLKG